MINLKLFAYSHQIRNITTFQSCITHSSLPGLTLMGFLLAIFNFYFDFCSLLCFLYRKISQLIELYVMYILRISGQQRLVAASSSASAVSYYNLFVSLILCFIAWKRADVEHMFTEYSRAHNEQSISECNFYRSRMICFQISCSVNIFNTISPCFPLHHLAISQTLDK